MNTGYFVSAVLLGLCVHIWVHPWSQRFFFGIAGVVARYVNANKIALAFLAVFIVFVIYVGQATKSLADIANSMSNWDVALEEE